MEQELRPITTLIRDALAGTDGLPDSVANLLDQGADPEHAALFDVLTAIIIAFAFQVMGSLVPPLLQSTTNFAWADHQTVPLTPSLLAVLVNKGWMTEADAATQAGYSGIDAHRFSNMVNAVGMPPGPAELMFALRRGIIDQTRFEHGIRESDIRPEWLDVLTALRFSPISAAEAIAALVEGHLDEPTARKVFAENGIDPQYFDAAYQTAGRPPGAQEMIALLRRGLMSEADVTAGIRESNIKNKYIPAILNTRVHIPPMRTVISMLRKGVITTAQATKYLTDLGFEPDVIAGMIREASTDATAHAKQLTAAAYLTAYRDGLAADTEVTAGLVALGYQPADAAFLIRTATYARDHAASAQVVGVIRSRFVAHRIDANTAQSDLAALGLDGANIAHLLGMWQLARDATITELTAPQVSAMFKKKLITEPDYRARLDHHGYAPVDIDLLVRENAPA